MKIAHFYALTGDEHGNHNQNVSLALFFKFFEDFQNFH